MKFNYLIELNYTFECAKVQKNIHYFAFFVSNIQILYNMATKNEFVLQPRIELGSTL